MSHPPNTMSSRLASGTKSLILGARPSVRLPRRMVPICVSEPIGGASPLRMAITPAMVVVLTAPRPTSSTPSLPRAGAISTGGVTTGHYIMAKMRLFLRESNVGREPLAVSMSSVRSGERVLQIGVNDPHIVNAIAGKTGITGLATVIVPDESGAQRISDVVGEGSSSPDVRIEPV